MSISLFSGTTRLWLQVAVNHNTTSYCQQESPELSLLFASEEAVGTCDVMCNVFHL